MPISFLKRISLALLVVALSSCGKTPKNEDSQDSSNNLFFLHIGAQTRIDDDLDSAAAEICYKMTFDSQGNLYCVGETDGDFTEANAGVSDIFVLKISAAGVPIWAIQLGAVTATPGGDSTNMDRVAGIAVDSAGNVFVGGYTFGDLGEATGGGADVYLMKLNSSGQIQFLNQYGAVTAGPGADNSGNEIINDMVMDSSGNLYMAGSTDGGFVEANGGSSDALFLKFDPTGALVWGKQLGAVSVPSGGGTAGYETCSSVAIDTSSNVYCAGYTNGVFAEAAGGGAADAIAIKLSSLGALVWAKQIGSASQPPGGSASGIDSFSDLAVDNSGNVFLSGTTYGGLGEASGGGADVFVARLNSAGALQWLYQLGSVTKSSGGVNSGNDIVNSVELNPATGDFFVAGSTSGSLIEINGGGTDLFILKFSSAGALQSAVQYGQVTKRASGVNTGNEDCSDIQLHSNGNIFCAGSSDGSFGEQAGGQMDMIIFEHRF